jgi:hypothetical protein
MMRNNRNDEMLKYLFDDDAMEKAAKNRMASLGLKIKLSELIERLKAYWLEGKEPGELKGKKIGLCV